MGFVTPQHEGSSWTRNQTLMSPFALAGRFLTIGTLGMSPLNSKGRKFLVINSAQCPKLGNEVCYNSLSFCFWYLKIRGHSKWMKLGNSAEVPCSSGLALVIMCYYIIIWEILKCLFIPLDCFLRARTTNVLSLFIFQIHFLWSALHLEILFQPIINCLNTGYYMYYIYIHYNPPKDNAIVFALNNHIQ